VLGYASGNLDPLREMIADDRTVMGGSDGGAHCSFICDASSPTFMLTHWVRDRSRGARLPLEFVVKKQTFDAARSVGLSDRGRLAPGLRADVNLIDLASLDGGRAHMVSDLPGGAQRLMQKASGYVATLVAGEPIREGTDDTGARPGRLVRSGRS
jgi:N-acyl-D-amino-acid deacylase